MTFIFLIYQSNEMIMQQLSVLLSYVYFTILLLKISEYDF